MAKFSNIPASSGFNCARSLARLSSLIGGSGSGLRGRSSPIAIPVRRSRCSLAKRNSSSGEVLGAALTDSLLPSLKVSRKVAIH